jgi:hypothetical protein
MVRAEILDLKHGGSGEELNVRIAGTSPEILSAELKGDVFRRTRIQIRAVCGYLNVGDELMTRSAG